MTINVLEKEQIINDCLMDGVINIDKLLSCNDFETIKDGLLTKPLTREEWLIEKYEEGLYREIFEWLVDNDNSYAREFISGEFKPGHEKNVDKFTKVAFYVCKNARFSDVNDKYLKNKDPKEVIDKIIKDLSLKIDKVTLTEGLTEEYFKRLLMLNEVEILVVKLCVKMEAVLRCDYKYEGTFEEMLNRYTNNLDNSDETDLAELLNKLRKKRNDIVHPTKVSVELSKTELEALIGYISIL